jgi:hypothetical protein
MAIAQADRRAQRSESEVPPKRPGTMVDRTPRRRWPRRLLLASGVAVLVVLGVVAFFFTAYELRTHPGAKSVGSAVHSFRGSESTPNPPASSYGLPKPGVYTMTGEGREHISAPPNSQTDGTVMPVTVSHLASGCWRWRIDFNVAHWEDYVFCPSGSGLEQPGDGVYETWDFGAMSISNLATVTCPADTVVLPADPKPGTVLSWACPERNTATGPGVSSTTALIVGPETLGVGPDEVPTVEEQQTGTLSGTQTGSVTSTWWFEVSTGLPVRVERHIVVHTTSPIGTITYTDDGVGQLTSLKPRT